jgi:hypothetical protein
MEDLGTLLSSKFHRLVYSTFHILGVFQPAVYLCFGFRDPSNTRLGCPTSGFVVYLLAKAETIGRLPTWHNSS